MEDLSKKWMSAQIPIEKHSHFRYWCEKAWKQPLAWIWINDNQGHSVKLYYSLMCWSAQGLDLFGASFSICSKISVSQEMASNSCRSWNWTCSRICASLFPPSNMELPSTFSFPLVNRICTAHLLAAPRLSCFWSTYSGPSSAPPPPLLVHLNSMFRVFLFSPSVPGRGVAPASAPDSGQGRQPAIFLSSAQLMGCTPYVMHSQRSRTLSLDLEQSHFYK